MTRRRYRDPLEPQVHGPCPDTQCADVASAVGLERLGVTDEQIKHMVNRFLKWRLPANFNPDAGISFKPEYNVEFNALYGKPPARHEPVGTNLFDAEQAEAMVRYMVEGMPENG